MILWTLQINGFLQMQEARLDGLGGTFYYDVLDSILWVINSDHLKNSPLVPELLMVVLKLL